MGIAVPSRAPFSIRRRFARLKSFMPKTLQEYADWLDGRDLKWPLPPKPVDAKATPFTKKLPGIRAVTWSVYGTLVRITDGELLFDHPDAMRMQIALDKTIQEFKMWQSMNRKPGEPWKLLYEQYKKQLNDQQMGQTIKGDFPEVDGPKIWRKLLARLGEKDYDYNLNFYGDPEELSDKLAYFFHACLQGTEAAPNAHLALMAITNSPLRQALLSDAQPFTIVQMLRALKQQGTLPPLGGMFALSCSTLSFQEGLRKPSKTLYSRCLQSFAEEGIQPDEVLHVGSRLKDDLAIAKQAGMKTALYAADMTSLRATKAEMQDPAIRPDRLLTDLSQIREVLALP